MLGQLAKSQAGGMGEKERRRARGKEKGRVGRSEEEGRRERWEGKKADRVKMTTCSEKCCESILNIHRVSTKM